MRIVEIATQETVKAVDVTGKSERAIDRIERGMLAKIDRERFYVQDTGDDDDD